MRILFIAMLFLAFCLGHKTAEAQEWQEFHLKVGMMRPAFPFSKLAGVFEAPLHPLIEVGATYQWNKSEKSQWLQEVNAGFGYHRFLQAIVPITTNIDYRHIFKKKWSTDAFLGAGYLHSFALNKQYEFKNGVYAQTGKAGKAQFMFRIGLGLRYQQFTLRYETFLQAPFIKSYVPLIPYNVVSVGYSVPFHTVIKKHQHENPAK